jgi:hypothetical protein
VEAARCLTPNQAYSIAPSATDDSGRYHIAVAHYPGDTLACVAHVHYGKFGISLVVIGLALMSLLGRKMAAIGDLTKVTSSKPTKVLCNSYEVLKGVFMCIENAVSAVGVYR